MNLPQIECFKILGLNFPLLGIRWEPNETGPARVLEILFWLRWWFHQCIHVKKSFGWTFKICAIYFLILTFSSPTLRAYIYLHRKGTMQKIGRWRKWERSGDQPKLGLFTLSWDIFFISIETWSQYWKASDEENKQKRTWSFPNPMLGKDLSVTLLLTHVALNFPCK